MSPPKHRGLYAYRYKTNPEEQRFADAWAKLNEGRQELLAYLLDPEAGEKPYANPINAGDALVAATVIQWLGSPVGQEFLRELGYGSIDARR